MATDELSLLRSQLEEMQKRVTRSLATEQALINSRHLIDQEIQRFRAIHEYGLILNGTPEKEAFTDTVAEAVVDIFELEMGLVWLTDSEEELSDKPCAAADFGDDLDWTEIRQWLSLNLFKERGSRTGISLVATRQNPEIPSGIDRIIATTLSAQSGQIEGVIAGIIGTKKAGFYETNIAELQGSFGVFGQLVATLYKNHLNTAYIREQNAQLEERVAKQARELIQSEKLASLGTLAAGIAHEINNPVGYVSSNVKLLEDSKEILSAGIQALMLTLKKGESADPDYREILANTDLDELDFIRGDLDSVIQDTMEGVKRISTIVNGLKRFSHPSTVTKQSLDLNECIRIASNITNNEIKFQAKLDLQLGELPLIEGNESEIVQVFVNMLINAVQAMDRFGQIQVTSRFTGQEIEVKISDTGRGIAPEHLGALFEPFFTTKKVGEGTGLGLSISHGIVHDHGGRITVNSELGSGTTFTLYFPSAES